MWIERGLYSVSWEVMHTGSVGGGISNREKLGRRKRPTVMGRKGREQRDTERRWKENKSFSWKLY